VETRSIFAATIAAKRQAGCIELNMFLHTLVQDATKKLCIEGNTTDYVWCRDLSFNNLSGDVPINGSFSLFTPIRYPRLSLSTSFSARAIHWMQNMGHPFVSNSILWDISCRLVIGGAKKENWEVGALWVWVKCFCNELVEVLSITMVLSMCTVSRGIPTCVVQW
jgi:hypothetical protein